MNKVLALGILLLLATPLALAETKSYGPVVGVGANGNGAAAGEGQPTFLAPAAFTTAVATVSDDLGERTFISVCVNVVADNLCSRARGDLQMSGYDSVTLTGFGTLPAGTLVTAYVYTLMPGLDSNGNPVVGLGTTGTVTVTFS